jgi:hypothetical protein
MSADETIEQVRWTMEHGTSPEADAARTLFRFMTCQAGMNLVEHGLLRRYGYTLTAEPVVAQNRRLADALQYTEVLLADLAEQLKDGDASDHRDLAAELTRVRRYMRREREANSPAATTPISAPELPADERPPVRITHSPTAALMGAAATPPSQRTLDECRQAVGCTASITLTGTITGCGESAAGPYIHFELDPSWGFPRGTELVMDLDSFTLEPQSR